MSSNYNVEFTRNRSSFESPSLRFAIAVSKECAISIGMHITQDGSFLQITRGILCFRMFRY